MGKTKAKRGSFWQDQMLPFVVVWVLSMGLVEVISRVAPAIMRTAEAIAAFRFLVSTLLAGCAQVVLVERLLRRLMRGWMIYTLIGAVITLILNSMLPSFYFGSPSFLNDLFPNYNPLGLLAQYAPLVVMQSLWLLRRVKHAWIWPLMTLPLSMAFSLIPYASQDYLIVKLITLISATVVQAGLMHYLWQHPKDQTRLNLDLHSTETPEEDRITRLQEHDQSPSVWDRNEDQGLQADAL